MAGVLAALADFSFGGSEHRCGSAATGGLVIGERLIKGSSRVRLGLAGAPILGRELVMS
jgi:hypothetical protein